MGLFWSRIVFQALAALIALVISILTARWLGPEGKGILSIVLLMPFIAALVSTLGVHEAAAFVCGRRGVAIAEMAQFARWLLLLLGPPVGAFLIFFFRSGGAGILGQVFPPSLCLLVGGLFFSKLWILLGRGILRTDERFNEVLRIDILEVLLPLALILLVGWLGGRTVESVSFGFLVSAFCTALLVLIATSSYKATRPTSKRIRHLLQLSTSYGMKNQLRLVGAIILQRANFLVVGALMDMKSVGIYAVANAVSEVVARVPDGASWFLTPRIAKLNEKEGVRATVRYLRVVFSLTCLGALGVAVAAPVALPFLFGTRFAGAVPVLSILLAGIIVSSVGRVLAASLIGRGYAGKVGLATWLGGAVMLGLDLLLIPKWGLVGAGIGACVGYLVNTWITVHSYLGSIDEGSMSGVFGIGGD